MSIEQLVVEPSQVTVAPRRSVFGKLLRDPQAVITMAILFIIVMLGILTPLLTSIDPNEAQLSAYNAPPGTPGHILGADQSGRDIASRLLHSISTSVIAGLIGASVALVIGTVFGLIGGYFGTKVRAGTEWLFNLIMTFPGLLLLILLMPVTKGDYRATMLIFGVLLSPGIFRIVRNLVVGVKNELFVDAARVSGLSNLRILARHVLFVIRGPIIIATAFMIGSAIGIQSGLAFLGVGSNTVPSFGAMIAEGFGNLYVQPVQFVWPSLMLGLMTASLVLLGNSLRDAFEGVRPKAARATRRPVTVTTESAAGDDALLVVKDLAIGYPTPSGSVREVVTGVSLRLEAGKTLGVVGESGSGKTQTAFAVLGVLPPDARILRGSITLNGRELLDLPEAKMRQLRGREIAYIPQEPMSNLDPSYTVGAQLVEGIRASSKMTAKDAKARVLELLARVGITDPRRTFESYPHQISGGMAQRVLIAGAVASRPTLLIADEPTTALDVTVQADILDLLRDLQQEMGMAVLIVTHNFGVVADLCDHIAVMTDGKVVEEGTALDIFRNPQHEYTQMLLGSILEDTVIRTDAPSRPTTEALS
ncbi:MAG: dipeptide/oligopeptide/nickel ABC transporter permease/ATP-binding protein [Rhodoglobus sp.]